MKSSASWTLPALFLASIPAYALDVRFEDLEKWVGEKNGHVAAANHLAESAKAETGHLVRAYLPRLTGVFGYERFKTGTYSFTNQPYGSLEASVNLFRSGRDGIENQVLNAKYDFAVTESKIKFRTELLEARREYWSLLYTREVLASLEEALTQNEKNLSSAKKRMNAGMGSETDRYEFEIYQTQIEQDVARLTLQQQNSERALLTLVGADEGATIQLGEAPHVHDENSPSEKLAAESQLDFQKDRINESIASFQSRLASRWWMPSLDAYANYSLSTFRDREYLSRDDRFETVLGARLTFFFFDGLVGRSQSAAESSRGKAYREEARQTYREAQSRFENAQAQLKLTHDLVHGTERNVEQSRKYLSGTLSEYQRGIKNSPDVLSASQRFLEYRRRLAELKRDYGLAQAELLAMLNR